MSKAWKAIAAMSLNRVIGKDNDIPWRIPEDWKWVKEKTRGQIIVMGRKTFQTLGKPLPDRENIVVSRSLPERLGIRVLRDLEELEKIETEKEIWIFGGGEIYRQALPRCSEFFLTVVNRVVDGDTFFPEFEEDFDFREFVREEEDFRIKHYVKRKRFGNLNWTFSTLGCPACSLEEAISLACHADIRILEIRALEDRLDMPSLFLERYGSGKALKGRLEESGMRIIALDTSLKLVGPTEEDRTEFLDFVSMAEELDVPTLRVFDGGGFEEKIGREDLASAVETVLWWQGLRRRNGWKTDIIIETHNALTTTPSCLAFLESFRNPPPLLWDSHHTWRRGGENPLETWKALKGHIRHIHVKDSVNIPSARHPYTYTHLGEGEFELDLILKTLARDGFKGPVSIEWEKKWHPYLPPLEEALEKARERFPW